MPLFCAWLVWRMAQVFTTNQSEESHKTVIPDFFRHWIENYCLHLFVGERIDARLKIALSPPPHWIAYWYCRKKPPVNLLVVVKRLSVCSVVKKHSLKLSEKSTGSRVAKVWGSIPGAQFAKRDATRPRLPSFFAPPRIYFSSSQVCGSLIIKSLCGKIYLPLPSFSLNRQKTVLDSCAHRNAPSTRNIQQKGKNFKQTVQKVVQFLSPDSRRVQGTHWRNLGTSLTNAALHAFTKKWGFWIWLS